MPDRDVVFKTALDAVLPLDLNAEGEWSSVLQSAAALRWPARLPFGMSRRRTAVVAVVLAAGVAAALGALAVAAGWVLDGSRPPAAAGEVLAVTGRQTAGRPWTLAAYRSTAGLCVVLAFVDGRSLPSRTPLPADSATDCDAGRATTAGGGREIRFFGSTLEATGRPLAFVAGVTSDAVTRIEASLRPSGSIGVATIPVPEALATEGRVFAVVVARASIAEIAAIGADGTSLNASSYRSHQ